MSACARALLPEYRRREPERTALHEAVRTELATFLATHEVPAHVRRALRGYLDCGILAKGFVRVRCPDCRAESLVAFSCKDRSFCPSCTARRASETAAHLVERVLPHVPMRQWVLALPPELHRRAARDSKLQAKLLGIFLEELSELLRATTKTGAEARSGSVTFIQQFGSTLNLHVHFHLLTLDGVYVSGDERPVFVRAPAPTREQVRWLCDRVATRARRVVGRGEPESDERPAAPVLRLHDAPASEPPEPRLHARVDGWDLHASKEIEADDRVGLERFLRYCLRGPIAEGRLRRGPRADLLIYELRRPKPDGTTHLVLSPLALLERLALLVPLPRRHMIRYSGVLAPAAEWREKIVPVPPAEGTIVAPTRGRRRLDWANLLRRVFLLEVLACACGGRRRVISSIEEGSTATKILRHLGLNDQPPKLEPARVDQPDFWPTGPPDDDTCEPLTPLTVSLSSHDFDQRSPHDVA